MRIPCYSRVPARPSARPLVQTENTIASTIWTPSGTNPVISKSNGINEFDLVLHGGTYNLFWSPDTDFATHLDTAPSLDGPWTAQNSGNSVFNGRYCTVIYDASLGIWRAWASDVVNHAGDIRYLTASNPAGPWTDQGSAITSPGSGPFSNPCPLDPCVRIMPDGSYIMTATDITYTVGEVGFYTSPTGMNGTWTLSRYPIPKGSFGSFENVRYDPSPFIDSSGQVVIIYGGGNPTGAGNSVGMTVYDQSVGGWAEVSEPLMVGPLGNPEIFEFTPGSLTLVWASYPNEPTTTDGGLSYATGSSGSTPALVARAWDNAVLP